jgi:hypothetical protein
MLYSFSDVIRYMESRRMRWAGLVARRGEREKCRPTMFWRGSPKERDHSEDGGVGGRMG